MASGVAVIAGADGSSAGLEVVVVCIAKPAKSESCVAEVLLNVSVASGRSCLSVGSS